MKNDEPGNSEIKPDESLLHFKGDKKVESIESSKSGIAPKQVVQIEFDPATVSKKVAILTSLENIEDPLHESKQASQEKISNDQAEKKADAFVSGENVGKVLTLSVEERKKRVELMRA